MDAGPDGLQDVTGGRVVPYLLFSNGHDGRHAVRVAVTPIRVVCQNTLNLALRKADLFIA